MKILFVIRSLAHFSYYDLIIEALLQEKHQVVVLADKIWSSNYPLPKLLKKRKLKNLIFDWSVRRTDVFRKAVFSTRELLTYSSYLNFHEQAKFYLKRWEKYQPKFIQNLSKYPVPER